MNKKNLLVLVVIILFSEAIGFAQGAQRGARIVLQQDSTSANLKFLDANEKEIKTIELTLPGKSEIKETRKSHPKLKREALVKGISSRKAVVSKAGENALVLDTISETLIPETDEEKKAIGDTDADYLQTTSEVSYLDLNGNTLWKKRTPKNMEFIDAKISEDGQRVAFVQSYVMGGLEGDEPYERLIVMNKIGDKLFEFPGKRDELRLSNGVSISPAGRYVGVVGQNEKRKEITLFFDLQNKTRWIVEQSYVISTISDNGIAKISYPNPNIKETDSYEKKIKEGIITETINLKLVLGE